MTREERISHYEAILDRAERAADQLEKALAGYRRQQRDLKALEAYYTGPEWREDLAADEAGLLPGDLRRGVLSEDAVYDLLERYRELQSLLREG